MDNETRLIAATDRLGRRVLPVGGERKDRYVGIFYFLWLGQHVKKDTEIYDNTKLLKSMPEVLWDTAGSKASPVGEFHFWGEPLFGYYNSLDEWVMRRHIKMLTLAGVDFLVFDTTNAITYDAVWEKLFAILEEYRLAGWNVPKVAFYTNTDSGRMVKHLYDVLYAPGRYRDLWFTRGGKPLIIGVESEIEQKLLDFFWFRPSQWPNEPDRDGGFPWIDWRRPQKLYGDVISVSVAQHPGLPLSDSVQFKEHDSNWGRGFHDGKNDKSAIERGANFEEQWKHAIECDPEIVFVTGWNEWIAIKFAGNPGGKYGERVFFVDCADEEFSRDVEPMLGGYGDNFYLQLARNIRRYKGTANQGEKYRTAKTLDIYGDLSQWDDVKTIYRGFGDRTERDFVSHSPKMRYTAPAPRNAICEVRVADDEAYLYFYIRAAENIELYPDERNCRNIFIAPLGGGTGLGGFDYVVGREIYSGSVSSVHDITAPVIEGGAPRYSRVGTAEYNLSGRTLQLRIPRAAVNLGANEGFIFKVADGVECPDDMMSYYTSGDCVPFGRLGFAYGV